MIALTLGRLYTILDADSQLGKLILPLLADTLTSDDREPQVPEVAGAVVCALEGMACASAQTGESGWVYEQALQLLLKLYKEPTMVSGGSGNSSTIYIPLYGVQSPVCNHSQPDVLGAGKSIWLLAVTLCTTHAYPCTYIMPSTADAHACT